MAKLDFELATPGSAVRGATYCIVEPGVNNLQGYLLIAPITKTLLSKSIENFITKKKTESFQIKILISYLFSAQNIEAVLTSTHNLYF